MNTLTNDSSKAELILRSEVEVDVSNLLRRDSFEDDSRCHGIELSSKKYLRSMFEGIKPGSKI